MQQIRVRNHGIILSNGGTKMKITLNPDKEIVAIIKDGLEKKGGYCPCRMEMTEDTKCMCTEFKQQIADPDFEGFCHCMLYYKSR
jgi:ferredoxin-thioredoxin reductase catalytic subunit